MDIEPHRVLVCVSPGEECAASLELAVSEAVRRRCGVHLALAVGPLWIDPVGVTDLHLVAGEWRRLGAEFLADCEGRVRDLGEGAVPVSSEIVHGHVATALVEASENAALVVLQHHRMGRKHAVPTLSVSNGVASRAHASVVTVPDDWREGLAPSDIVAVGVDDATGSAEVVRWALEEARRLGGSVLLAQAWFYPPAWDLDLLDDRAEPVHSAALGVQLRRDLADLLEEFADVPHEVVAVHGRPADVLVARSHRARRLVVGRHDPVFTLGSHLGPVTRAVLNHAVCPVVVVDPLGDPRSGPQRACGRRA